MQKLTKEDFFKRKKIDGECWIYSGYIDRKGYGQLWFRGKHYYAHQLSYVLSFGSIPRGKEVAHTRDCKSRACINPKHLYAATHRENMADARVVGKFKDSVAQQRKVLKSLRHQVAVSETQRWVELYNSGTTMTQISKDFHVSLSTVSYALSGKRRMHYAHI